MDTNYTAIDGKKFTDAVECARHDLLNVPNILSSLDKNINDSVLPRNQL